MLARYRTGVGTVWYLADVQGTIRDLAGPSGALLNRILLDSFGNVVLQTNPTAGDRFLFTVREFDAQTGLYYWGHRKSN